MAAVTLAGGSGALNTVTVAVELFAEPQPLLTLTRYFVVELGVTMRDDDSAPGIAVATLLAETVYHWYDSGAVPEAAAISVADCPCVIDVESG